MVLQEAESSVDQSLFRASDITHEIIGHFLWNCKLFFVCKILEQIEQEQEKNKQI